MSGGIVVTGLGVVCSIGVNAQECLASLKAKRSGIGEIKYLKTAHRKEFKLGEVKRSNLELLEMLGLSSSDKSYCRTTLLAGLAAKEALEMANAGNTETKRTGFVSSTTVGGMDITEQKYLQGTGDNSYLLKHPCGDSTKQVADILQGISYYTTLNTACSSGINALIHGARLLKHRQLDRVIVGGVDALTMFTLNGFNALMILDKEDCKPFDANRKGLNLAEGAGYIVLERASEAKHPLCSLKGYANANDAYHQTASSPTGEGAYSSMTEALEMSGLNPTDIDYINVHGTGTGNNDESEGVALNRVFGKGKVPAFSSTKSYTGHTLAGAAGVESVFSILSIINDIIYPSLNWTTPIENLELIPNTEVILGSGLRNVLSNSFGFGGNNSTVIFSK